MRCRRFVAPVLVGVALSLLSGCTDSTSPAAKAWERSTAQSRAMRQTDPQGALVASDGLGRTVFTPDAAVDTTHGRSTFAHVPQD
jgi:hypothetical protein